MSLREHNHLSITFYNHEKKVMFIEYCHSAEKAINWVNAKKILWTHCNVWHRKTRQFIEQIKNS